MRNKFFLFLFFLFFYNSTDAQAQKEIRGIIQDSLNSKMLPYATIALYKTIDTSLITYRISNEKGIFIIKDLKLSQPFLLVATYSGYTPFQKIISFENTDSILRLDTIKLFPSNNTLEEVRIINTIPPVTYKNDTIEFNASAFKTLPTAFVEDLLRKLPGVTVDQNGLIYVEGKLVNRILVDGKSFFGGDPKMATKNLPADIIHKVQVVPDEEEYFVNPTKTRAELGKVINLTLKKSVKKQVFGKTVLGFGTNKRWEGSLILNTFRDTLQVSILGFGNNINRAAFGYSELRDLGGFKRSNTSLSLRTGGGILINNISFGGTEQGILTSYGGGVNLNNDFNKKTSLNFQYFHGRTKNSIFENSRQNQFLKERILLTLNQREEIRKSFNHRLGGTLKWQDKKIRIEYKPVVLIGESNNQIVNDYSIIDSVDGQNTLLNTSNIIENNKIGSFEYSHGIFFSKQFKKAGRLLTLSQSIISNKSNFEISNNSKTILFGDNNPPQEEGINQLRLIKNKVLSTSLNSTFKDPISKIATFVISNNGLLFNGSSDFSTFDFNGVSQKYDQFIPNLSNALRRQLYNNDLSLGTDLTFKSIRLGIYANHILIHTKDVIANNPEPIYSTYHYLQPRLNLKWKTFDLSYTNSVAPPQVQDVLPVRDIRNPTLITVGNINLKPTVTQTTTINHFKYYKSPEISTNIYVTFQQRKNSVLYSRIIDSNGIQTVIPINIAKTKDFVGFLSFSKTERLQNNLSLNLTTGFSYILEKRYVQINNQLFQVQNIELFPTLSLSLNWRDQVELRSSMSLSKRKQEIPFITNALNTKTNFFRNTNEVTLRLNKKSSLEISSDYQSLSTPNENYYNNVFLLNSSFVLQILRDSRGQLKVSVFDLLNNNKLISRYVSDNFLSIRQANVLTRYLMFTFHYDLKGMSLSKNREGNPLLLF